MTFPLEFSPLALLLLDDELLSRAERPLLVVSWCGLGGGSGLEDVWPLQGVRLQRVELEWCGSGRGGGGSGLGGK